MPCLRVEDARHPSVHLGSYSLGEPRDQQNQLLSLSVDTTSHCNSWELVCARLLGNTDVPTHQANIIEEAYIYG